MATQRATSSHNILQIDDYWFNDDSFTTPPSRDPYLRWAELTNFRSLQGGAGEFPERLSFIVERSPDSRGWEELDLLDSVDVEAAYLHPMVNTEVSRFATLRVITKDLTNDELNERVLRLLKHPDVARLQLGYPRGRSRDMGQQNPAPPTPPKGDKPRPMPPEPAEVVMGIIDDGCPFAHPDLLDPAGHTRLALIWLQTTYDETNPPWDPPNGFKDGRVLERPAMTAFMKQSQPGGILDEILCYQAAFATLENACWLKPNRALLSRESHGGSVMAVAAGRPPNLRGMRPGYEMGDDLHGEPGDAASRCPLIFVNLPREQVEVSSGRWMPVNALDALRFILQQARARFTHAVGSRVPVVVNLSYGSTAGSHSGGAMFECALDELLAADEHLAATLAAGNSRDAESHAQLDVPARRSASLGLFVPPSTPFDTFVEFWLPPKADLSTITVTVTTPEGLEMAVSGSKRESVLEDGFTSTDTPEVRARKRTAALFLFPKVVQATDRTMVTLVVCGTVHSPRRQTLATAGPWRVTVKNGGKSALRVQCWVERDEVGTRRPQAARFFSVKVEKRGFERVIRTTNTLSNLATGAHAFAVGGYRRAATDGPMADYSGAPPEDWKDQQGEKRYLPFAAKSDAGKTHPGVRVPGNRGNVSRRMNGTSVAAPQATRYVANQMAAGKTRVQIEYDLPKEPKPLPSAKAGHKPKIDPRDGRKRL